jgi:hypothetical protein
MTMDDSKKMIEKLTEHYGSRIGLLGWMILNLSMSGQPCDITFYKRKPLVNVKIDQSIGLAVMYGVGAKKFADLLSDVKLSTGEVVNISEIWGVTPMPKGGFTEEELQAVDMAKAEEHTGPNGETLRKMISDTYHCETKEEEDKFLRRFIAS